MGMINEELKEYLELKFGDVIAEIKQHSKDLPRIEQALKSLEDFRRDHLKSHEKSENKTQFTIGQIIVLIVCLATILAAKFL